MNKNLSIRRGDDHLIPFQRINKKTKEVITKVPDKMYFTVKRSCCEDEPVLQKTLGNGIVYDEQTAIYYVSISKTDTCELMYFDYEYDIEIIDGAVTTTILIGELKVEKEVTHLRNEV